MLFQNKQTPPEPSIAVLAPGTIPDTSAEGAPQRKPSEKKTSILINTTANLKENELDKKPEQSLTQPKVQTQTQSSGNPALKKESLNQPKKSAQGGTLGTNTKKDQDQFFGVNVKDQTLNFSLKSIIDCMVSGNPIQNSEIQKIENNFKLYVREKTDSLSLESISAPMKTQQGQENAPRILNLFYMNELEKKSKILLNQFWSDIIKSVCIKLPFLSVKGCLNIVKLHIGMNKHIYCLQGNQGTFDIKKFSDPKLYPIINDNITINRNHPFFKKIQDQVENICLQLFSGMKLIFKEIAVMKTNPTKREKYERVFNQLERKKGQEGKSKVIKSLLSSFENMIVIVNQQFFEHYVVYFECVVESLWHYYLAETQLFGVEDCLVFLKFLNENYLFFNLYGINRSRFSSKFVQFVEKLALSFLFKHPLRLEKWPNQLNNLIFNSNLEMFEPFKYLLEYSERQDLEHPKLSYPLRGIHWKEFIDNVITLRRDDAQSINFIINSLESFLVTNADLFWSDPSNFESYMTFCIRYNAAQAGKGTGEQLRIILLNLLRIASSLMGQNLQELRELEQPSEDVGVEYPQSRRFPYALKVYHQFSQNFLKIHKKEFLQILADEVKTTVLESTEYPNEEEVGLNGITILKPQNIIKTYLLKLISSEPFLLFDIKKYVKEMREEDLVNFLIFRTIKNPSTQNNLLNLAYTALDSLLINSKTSGLIENILGLGEINTSKSLPALAERLFLNPEAIPFISRHCNILIDCDYQSKEWTKELLKIFYKSCQQYQGSMLAKKTLFTISYCRLLSNIVGRLNLRTSQNLINIKPFVNVAFIIESIKIFLKFDKFQGNFINVIVQRQQKQKIEALIESIRLFSSILLYCLKERTTKKTDNDLYTGSLAKIKNPILKAELISPLESRELGIEDKQFHLQVSSMSELTTSYVNALSFILINSTFEQKKLLKSVNFDYETLIFETIESLVKLNPKQDIKNFFTISKGIRSLSDLTTSLSTVEHEKSLLNRFLSYIEQSMNETGVEMVVFGNLITQPQRLRKLIDNVRNKLETKSIRQRIKPALILKIVSTLSRYFRNAMLELSLHKKRAFTDLHIQDHFEYLLQTIINCIDNLSHTNKPHKAIIIDDTLANFYGGLLTVQTFSHVQFFKWIKIYHALLLSDINLKYLRNLRDGMVVDEERSSYALGEEYFKLLSLFLNCDQYLTESEFKIIADIKSLPDRLSAFILNIVRYSDLSRLPIELSQILLETLTMSINLYVRISTNDEQLKSLLTNVLTYLKTQKLPTSTNLILLEIQLYNYLNVRYSSEEIDFSNMDQWPLQMNCIDVSLSTPIVRKIISSLKKTNLSSTSFVSVCNGLMYLIEHSQRLEQSKNILIKDLFDVFNYFSNLPETTTSRVSLQRTTSSSYPVQPTSQSNLDQSTVSYKRVWILELLLTILTNSDINGTLQRVENQYETIFVSDESILKRFGLLMRKLAFCESQIYMAWLPQLDSYIQSEILPGQSITFAQKMQLNQILKMFNFILANHSWTNHFADGISDLIEAFVMYRKNFQKLISSQKKPKHHTAQQSILEAISIGSFIEKDEMMKSAVHQMNRESISVHMLKSSNCFELMHEIINIELTTQYALICTTIAQPQHLAVFRKNPLLSDSSKWNIVLLEILEPIAERHIEMTRHEKVLRGIFKSFTEFCYETGEKNLELSNEMLFTNCESLSCCLNSSFDLLTQVLIETLEMLLETVYGINHKLQQELHSDFKPSSDKFTRIVQSLKRNDKYNLNWGKYDPSERKAIASHTVRSHITKTLTANSHSFVNKSNR